LNDADAKAVHDSQERRNLTSCQNGLSTCQPLELDANGLEAARRAFRNLNVEACKHGQATCDPSLLTRPEVDSVAAATQQRLKLIRSQSIH